MTNTIEPSNVKNYSMKLYFLKEEEGRQKKKKQMKLAEDKEGRAQKEEQQWVGTGYQIDSQTDHS